MAASGASQLVAHTKGEDGSVMGPDEDEVNRQLARAVARLFNVHPKTMDIHSDCLWDPPLDTNDVDYASKRAASGRTLQHLVGNGIFEGIVKEADDHVVIQDARLTTAGYMLGQVSLAAVEADDEKLAALVARRIAGKH